MSKCIFTTSIAEFLTCSKDGEFDEFGFPINICKDYPCEKFKELIKEDNKKES